VHAYTRRAAVSWPAQPRDLHAQANFFLKARGPDSTNFVPDYHGFSMLHNLLRMTGAFYPQPLWGFQNRTAALFNGEIYNFRELEKQLRPHGPPFFSDGECILEAYAAWGDDFAQRLDGEYAIVVIDVPRGRLLSVQDTFGVKPLFLADDNGAVGFASYASGLTRVGHHNITRLSPNRLRIWRFEPKKSRATSGVQPVEKPKKWYTKHPNSNCYSRHGGHTEIDRPGVSPYTAAACKARCDADEKCGCVTHRSKDQTCWMRGLCTISKCVGTTDFDTYVQHIKAPASQSLSALVLERDSEIRGFVVRQHKRSGDAWAAAFEDAIRKRTAHALFRLALPLSGGFDSGAIHLAALRLGVPHDTYTVLGGNNTAAEERMMAARLAFARRFTGRRPVHHEISLNSAAVFWEKEDLRNLCEPYHMSIPKFSHDPALTVPGFVLRNQSGSRGLRLHTLTAAVGMSALCRTARAHRQLVVLSGSGADETMTDCASTAHRTRDLH
jgi:asparagine synthetase B (glutamine-hydrolysing)